MSSTPHPRRYRSILSAIRCPLASGVFFCYRTWAVWFQRISTHSALQFYFCASLPVAAFYRVDISSAPFWSRLFIDHATAWSSAKPHRGERCDHLPGRHIGGTGKATAAPPTVCDTSSSQQATCWATSRLAKLRVARFVVLSDVPQLYRCRRPPHRLPQRAARAITIRRCEDPSPMP